MIGLLIDGAQQEGGFAISNQMATEEGGVKTCLKHQAPITTGILNGFGCTSRSAYCIREALFASNPRAAPHRAADATATQVLSSWTMKSTSRDIRGYHRLHLGLGSQQALLLEVLGPA